MPSQYKLGAARRRWFTYIIAARARDLGRGGRHVLHHPLDARDRTDGGQRVHRVGAGRRRGHVRRHAAGRQDPDDHRERAVGTRHEVKVELARHKPYTETVDIPKTGGEVPVMALLKPVTGKLVINSQPAAQRSGSTDRTRGRTPTTINDVDLQSARKLELRLKDYQPYRAGPRVARRTGRSRSTPSCSAEFTSAVTRPGLRTRFLATSRVRLWPPIDAGLETPT